MTVWEPCFASQVTETPWVHSWRGRVRVLLQLYRPSFCGPQRLVSPLLLLPATFQLSVQSDGKPPLARHIYVAELPLVCRGGRTVSLGLVSPEK